MRETPLVFSAGYQLLDELNTLHVTEGWEWVPLRDDVDVAIISVLRARSLVETRTPYVGAIVHARVTMRGFASLERYFDRAC